MRNRFDSRDRAFSGFWRAALPALTFLLVFLFVMAGIRSVGNTTDEQQLKNLESSIRKSAVQCYALEGSYPPDLTYLTDNYGVTYDESRYLVSYQVFGSNMMPLIRVIPLK